MVQLVQVYRVTVQLVQFYRPEWSEYTLTGSIGKAVGCLAC